jgi:hypothetical protein
VVAKEFNLNITEVRVDGRLVRRNCSHIHILSLSRPHLMFLATRTVNKRQSYPRKTVFAWKLRLLERKVKASVH